MKAAVHATFGSPDVITVAEVPTPTPGAEEVLVRVHASTVGVVDSLARRGSPAYARIHFGLRKPRFAVLGCDFAGTVAAAGSSVTRFAVGDQVFGTIAPRFGAHAEYVCLPEQAAIAAKPANVSYAEAAALVDATALCFLRDKAHLRQGQAIAINGASGSVGADTVVDYTRADFARTGQVYDVIFDVAGKSSFWHCRTALSDTGIYLTTAPSPAIFMQMAWTARFGGKKAAVAFTGLRDASVKRADLLYTAELVEAGALIPVVDATYPLERIADAHRHVDAGHKSGNVVVTMA